VLKRRLFGRPGRFLVRTDTDAVEERHPKLHALLLDPREQAFPDIEPGPANKGLRRHPPGPEFTRHHAPLGAIVMPPQRNPKDLRGIALTVRRRCRGGTFLGGRTASINGSNTVHCASVSIQPASPNSEINARTAAEFRR